MLSGPFFDSLVRRRLFDGTLDKNVFRLFFAYPVYDNSSNFHQQDIFIKIKMGIPPNFVEDMEPQIHSIIKKHLGFSEPTLLTETIQALKTGATREVLTSKPIRSLIFF